MLVNTRLRKLLKYLKTMYVKDRLHVSLSIVHDIINRYKESGGMSVYIGQGCKIYLNANDLQSLR